MALAAREGPVDPSRKIVGTKGNKMKEDRRRVHQRFRRSLAAGAALLGAALAVPGQADIISAFYLNAENYNYEVKNMPDFDQRRPTLPNTGKYYCAPASVLNMMGYLANHGYPGLAPGPGHWQSQTKFLEAGVALSSMGSWMGTTAFGGTGGSGWHEGTWIWLDLSPYSGQFIVNLYQTNSAAGFWPRTHHLAKTASNGSLIAFGYGRYEYAGTGLFLELGERVGGHAITLARAQASGSSGQITLHSRDPWHESPFFNLDSQSTFANRVYDVETHINIGVQPWVWIDSLDFSNGDTIAVVDGYLGVVPVHGFGYTPGGHKIFILNPFVIDGFESLALSEYDYGDATIIDAAMHPDLTSMFALVECPEGGVKVKEMDAFTGETSTLLKVPTGKQISFGNNRLLYFLEDTRLYEMNIDIVPEDPGDPPPTQVMELPFPADALSFWDDDHKFLVLSASEKKLLGYRTDPVANFFGMPPAFEHLVDVPLAGKISMAVHPPDPILPPSVWLLSEASDSLFRISLQDGGVMESVMLPNDAMPTDISVNDLGDLFVSTADGLLQLTFSPDLGGWMPAAKPLFDHDDAFEHFHVARSRTNFHPAIHEGPGWEHIELEDEGLPGIPDCIADLNGDGTVDVFDLLELLGTWGSCADPCPESHCTADLNGDCTVDVFDLLELLGKWGECP